MAPSHKGKNGSGDKDKIPINSPQQLLEELKAFKAALSIKETEHTWEALDRAVKRFTAVTRGGGYRYEAEYVLSLKDRELAKAIVGVVSVPLLSLVTERTQLSASTLLFLSAATRLGPSFAPLLFLYLPHIIRLLSRTNKLYISRATACLTVIIGNTRLAGVIPYLREGMLEKSPTHRKGCMAGLLYAMGGSEPLTVAKSSSYEGMLVDKEIVRKRYLEDVETCMRIGTRDKDIEVRKIAKKCWEIYRSEFSERVASFAAPLTPIARKYLELPPAGQPAPDYAQNKQATSLSQRTNARAPPPTSVYAPPAPAAPRPKTFPPPTQAPPPIQASSPTHGPTLHTVHRAPARANLAASTGSNSAHTEARPPVQLSSSLNASQGGPPRPPPTLFARRVLPSSSSASSNAQTGDKYSEAILRGSTTFANHEPVASTSYAAPILPRSLTSEAIHHQVPAWPAHHRATTAPSASGVPDLRPSGPTHDEAARSRPTSALSHTSSIPPTSIPQTEQLSGPSSATSSRSTEQNEYNIDSAPYEAAQGPSASTSSRSVQPQQRRVVPTQVHRAPSRATRRASRVLPPSTDFQAFLSSTATNAASEFKWPASALASNQGVQSGPVDLPSKRPASAMSAASQAFSTVAFGDVVRHVTPSESHASVEAQVPIATEEEAAAQPPGSISTCPTSGKEDVESDEGLATKGDQQLATDVAFEDSASIHQLNNNRPSSVIIEVLESVEPEIVSTFAVEMRDGAESPKKHYFEEEQLSMPAQTSSLEVAQPDNVIRLSSEVQSSVALEPTVTAASVQALVASTSATANSLEPEIHAVDIADLAAKLSLAQASITSEASRPPLAGARQKTAFRPQKHHKPAEDVPWMPLPTFAANKEELLLPDSRNFSGSSTSSERGQEATVPVAQPMPSSNSQNPLKSFMGLSRSQAARMQASSQVSSASTSAKPAHQPDGSTNPTRSTHSAHPDRARQPALSTQRGAIPSEKIRPPPAKKQALSSSTGPTSGRPAFGVNSVRSAASISRPVVSAPTTRPIASKAGAARQGSIFSRLAAPTAASAGKAKARIPSGTRETFKKPAPPSETLAKKCSTLSLKSSQGATHHAPGTLKDATNTASRIRGPQAVSEKNVKSIESEKPQSSLASAHDADTVNSMPLQDAAVPILLETVRPKFQSEVSVPDFLKDSAHEQLSRHTLSARPDMSESEQIVHTGDGNARSSNYSKEPESRTQAPHRSDSILAELEVESNVAPVPGTTIPSAISSIPRDEFVEVIALSETSDQSPDLSMPNDSTVNSLAATLESKDYPSDLSVTVDSTKGITGPDLKPTSPADMPEVTASIGEDEVEIGDETVIIHDLGSLEGESDVALESIEQQQDNHSTTAQHVKRSEMTQANDAKILPEEDTGVSSNNADTPTKTAGHSPKASHQPSTGTSSPIPPAGVTHTFDSSLSILASPTRSMHDLLARSTGRKAQEEGSPLLMEKEYLPSISNEPYQYDETVLDVYISTQIRNPVPDQVANERDERVNTDAVDAQDDNDDDEEDEIALLISRELSSDSLEELASRWEESRVIGSLGLLDESNDDYDIENTPMRPRLLTRFSDGESSDYGSAPVGTATYTKDDEDAALDILLNMGHQRDTEADGQETDALLTESLLMSHEKESLPLWRTENGDRGILAEMSGYADTPKVSRSKQLEATKIGSTGIQGATNSILREGGIF